MEEGEYSKVYEESIDFYYSMAIETLTLWEKDSKTDSLNHGFNFLGYSFKFINNKLCVSVYNQTKRRINRNLNFLYKNNLDKFYRSLASYNGLFLRCNIDNYKYFVII